MGLLLVRGTVGRSLETQGSKAEDTNNRALGPTYSNVYGIWALKPYHLGPWTPRGSTHPPPGRACGYNRKVSARTSDGGAAEEIVGTCHLCISVLTAQL